MDRMRFAVAGALLTVAAAVTSGGESVRHDPAWVDQRVTTWQPTAAERRFDEIGWAKDIRAAERLARQHGRPVFLFTHDGRIHTGRC
jgi:hypothetical protein